MDFFLRSVRKIWAGLGHLQRRRPRRHSPHRWRRRYIGALILLALIMGATSYFWYFTTDERVRLQAINALQEVTGGQVELDSASLMVLREIRIKGLRIYLPDKPHIDDNLVLAADDVILEHVLWTIFTRRLQLRTVVAYGPRLQLWYDRDAKIINLQLLPLAHLKAIELKRPSIYLRNGMVEYWEYAAGEPTRKAQQMLNGKIYPAPHNKNLILFELASHAEGVLQDSSLHGQYNLLTRQLQTKGNFLLELVDFTNLPLRVSQWQKLYKMSQPTGLVETSSSYDPDTGHQVRFKFRDGRLNLPVPNVELPLHSVDAEIVCTNERVLLERLSGRYADYGDFEVTGVIEGYSSEAAFDLEIQTNNLVIPKQQWNEVTSDVGISPTERREISRQAAGPPMSELLPLLPAADRQLTMDLAPTGNLDLYLRLRRLRDQPMEKINYQGVLDFADASIDYHRFPYKLENVRGEVFFEPNLVTIGPVQSQQAAQKTQVRGRWRKDKEDRYFDITVQMYNLPLDEKLFAALRPWQQRLWKNFQPAGLVNAVYQLTLKNESQSYESLDVDMLNVDACFSGFPLPLTAVMGSSRYENDSVNFNIHQAQAGTGRLALRGSISDLRRRGSFECDIDFRNLELDDNFGDFLPDRAGSLYEQIGLRGWAEGRAHLYSTALKIMDEYQESHDPNNGDPWADLEYHITTDLSGGRILYEIIPYELSDVRAGVELSRDILLVKSLTGRHGTSRVSLDGYIDRGDDYQWHIRAEPLDLDESLRRALGEGSFPIWDKLNPEGQINLTLDLEQQEIPGPQSGAGPVKNYTAAIVPLNCRLQPSFFTYPFVNVNGRVTVKPGEIIIRELSGRDGPMQVGLSGNLNLGPQAQEYNLDVDVEALEIDERFQRALPETFRKMFDRLHLAGRIGADLQVTGRRDENQKGVWDFNGRGWLRDGSITWPTHSDQIDGLFQGEGSFDSESQALELSGAMQAKSLRIKQRPFTDMTAMVEYNGRSKEIKFDQISSSFCEGRLAGDLRAAFRSAPADYEFIFQFDDVNLAQLLESAKPEKEKRKNLRGQLAGRLNVIKTGDLANRRGTFIFDIKDAVLGELPIMARLLHVLNLSLPRQGAFNTASIKGDVVADIVRFDPIQLRGSAVSLAGVGIMTDPNNHLELLFEVESPHQLPKIPIISSFIKAIRPSLMQVQVSGQFDDPTVEPVAFPSLDRALRQLSGDLPKPQAQRYK